LRKIMPHPRFSNEEIMLRGEEIYDISLRSLMEPQYQGQGRIIDIETGEYEVDADSLAASKHMLAKHPGAALYGIRVGCDVVESFGGGARHTANHSLRSSF
jgi:hypothetical protein